MFLDLWLVCEINTHTWNEITYMYKPKGIAEKQSLLSCFPHLMFILLQPAGQATHQFCTHLVTTTCDLLPQQDSNSHEFYTCDRKPWMVHFKWLYLYMWINNKCYIICRLMWFMIWLFLDDEDDDDDVPPRPQPIPFRPGGGRSKRMIMPGYGHSSYLDSTKAFMVSVTLHTI